MAACEKQLGAEIVLHLIEVERRRLHVALGYGSLYAYGIAELNWSENVAHKRAKAARAAQACPEIVDRLASGELTLASVFVLAPHIEGDAGPALVAEACGKSRREVERLVADRFPEPPRGGNVRTKALAEGKTRLEITITERCEALLQEAAKLDGHRQAEMAEILEEALADYVAKRKARCHGQVQRPQTAPRSCDADRVSSRAKREVYERDGGRCSFVGKAGHRCASTYQLEYDHKRPRAHGGTSDADNLRLLCRVHNQFMAEEVIGAACVSAAKARASAAKDAARLAKDCTLALTTLGYSKTVAEAAVAKVAIRRGEALEEVVRAALQKV
jgi:5-methylcytosine-specific restriction endonuclease McrA